MDGVPVITQPSVPPGGEFLYEFALPDAGTFFYHPHQRSYEQLGRGLAGALIVEERTPPKVDRDVVWVLGSWSLERNASMRGDFGNFGEITHEGRIGNTVTINGRVPDEFAVRAGERVRLRLINAASARVFEIAFAGHRPWIIALDGQPVAPHQPPEGVIELGPAMRADVLLDMTGAPGSRHLVRDGSDPKSAYELVQLAYGPEPPVRERPADPVALPANPLSEPDVRRAERLRVVLAGGAMGNMAGLRRGVAWTLNGAQNGCSESEVPFDPLFTLRKDRSYVLELVNDTAWHHPIHLHGHAFRVLTRNGSATAHREWLDTVMLRPQERAEIAFVADNPGDWMLHCHVLEHQAGGMMACVRVA
jgi:FtsP/CotA-like multicopper oxidase with cupredoxin domain